MKSTGIVRRVDDLGRICLPKEIRRSLRIQEGDPLEIYVDGDKIFLKKYSPVKELGEFSQEYADTLHASTGFITLITDTDKVVCVAGVNKREYVMSDIGSIVIKSMESMNTIFIHGNGSPISELIYGNDDFAMYAVIAHIIVEGSSIGTVILCSATQLPGENEKAVAEVAAKFLAKQIYL